MGGGVVVFDFNNDGWEDLFLTGGVARDKLLIGNGKLEFEDASVALPYFPNTLETSGAISGDFNNDGFKDLFITTFDEERPNVLLMNDGDGGFQDLSVEAGIRQPAQSIGGTLIDYNLDGFVDIYVNNYIEHFEFLRDSTNTIVGYDHIAQGNFLYRNNQDGTFTEVSEELNAKGQGCTLASLGFLYDGIPAIYIANDFGEWVYPNELLVYDADEGQFINKAEEENLSAAIYGMGIALGDVGNDLDLDIYTTNLGRNVFYERRNNEYYDETDQYNVQNTKAWGELNE